MLIVLEYIEMEGLRISSSIINEPLIDKGDMSFIEVALSGKADALIRGNKRHFKIKSAKCLKILSPDEFLKSWKQIKKLG